MITFAKLRQGDWGARIVNEPGGRATGDPVTIRKKDGSMTTARLGTLVWRAVDGSVELWSLQSTARGAARRTKRRECSCDGSAGCNCGRACNCEPECNCRGGPIYDC